MKKILKLTMLLAAGIILSCKNNNTSSNTKEHTLVDTTFVIPDNLKASLSNGKLREYKDSVKFQFGLVQITATALENKDTSYITNIKIKQLQVEKDALFSIIINEQ